jgi:glyoxylase-like metal-dependent hydrolase (beta-lactamase superfamily II)
VIHPVELGDIRIYQLTEHVGGYVSPERFFRWDGSGGADQTIVRRQLTERGLVTTDGLLAMSYHSFLVRTPGQAVIVDTCIGNHKSVPARESWSQRTDERWLDSLRSVDIDPAEIGLVVCTHLHVDHVGWNTTWKDGVWVPTFPNARYVVAAEELDYAYTAANDPATIDTPISRTMRATFHESIAPIVDSGQLDAVPMDHAVDDFVRLRPLPGHTPGHVGVDVGRSRDRVIFVGDLAHSPIQLTYPDLSSGGDVDPELAIESRRRLLHDCASSGLAVCTMHFPGSPIGRVHSDDDGFILRA